MGETGAVGANHDIRHQIVAHLHVERQQVVVGVDKKQLLALDLRLLPPRPGASERERARVRAQEPWCHVSTQPRQPSSARAACESWVCRALFLVGARARELREVHVHFNCLARSARERACKM